ncbi:PAS domain S-box-containing protein [Paucibacter oligotrophus]|uniref:Sensory/regulatory protein RpfC n=1 Tax=Roseateles oligotrophus TaxID=1769250 RepID=A0A840L8H6_9BURK|nr:PAS-domain containing protein [Roseateles oligotrophus]MBB4844480.1 PAS domain S-box-containing protein [Roseateles oligotrophus]
MAHAVGVAALAAQAADGRLMVSLPLLALLVLGLLLPLALLGLWRRHRDISASKQLQLELARSMGVSKSLLDTIHRHAIVSVADAAGTIIDANEAFSRISGYSREELLGRNHRIVNSGQHPPEFWRELWAAISVGKSWQGEICNRSKSGEIYWVNSIIAPILDENGRVQQYISIRTDVTAARRARSDLAEQRERLARIIDGTHVGTWEWNEQTGEARFNERWASITGRKLAEMVPLNSRTWLRYIHPDDMVMASDMLARHCRGDTEFFECELRLLHSSGAWIWCLMRGKLYERDAAAAPRWIAGTLMDINARKRSEEELLRKQAALDRSELLAGLGGWEYDLQTRELIWSEQTCRLHDIPPGTPVTMEQALSYFSAEDRARLQQAMEKAKDPSESWDMELALHTDLGRFLWVRSVGEASFDDNGAMRIVGTYQDISAQRELEVQSKRNHQVLLSVMESLPCALSVFDSELNLRAYNRKFVEMFEFPAALFEEMPPRFESFIRYNASLGDYGEGEAMESHIQALIQRGLNPRPHHFEQHQRSGKVIEVRGAPMLGGGFVSTYYDISEAKRLAEEQRRSNELLRVVLDSLPCGLTFVDADFRLALHNRMFMDLYGLHEGEVQDKISPIEEVLRLIWTRGENGTLDLEVAMKHSMDVARASMLAPHQWERERPDGLVMEMRSKPVPSGGFVTTYTDIGVRKRAEAEVRRAEALLRGSIDAVNEAFVLFDPQDRLVFCNEKYRQVYAISADLIVPGARFEDIIRVGASRGQFDEAVGREEAWVQERLQAHQRGETQLVQKLGNGRWNRVIERRMDDGHIVGFRIDITEMMEAMEAAEEAARSKGQFLANMSHEIRTPMNAILGLLRLLQKTELTPRQQDYASKTEGAARSLLGLLNDILDFSKVEAGKMALDLQPFRVDQLFRDLSVILSANVGPKNVDILFDLDPALPPLLVADSMRLQQVLINLGGNASKFTQAGQVVLALRLARPLQPGDRVAELEFSVSDSGIGIAPEHQEKIFTGFSQAEASTTRRYGGTGLGLAISQRLVHLMGGSLQLDSELGRGSRFYFTLSLGLDAPAQAGDARLVQALLPALRTLVVDDNPAARELLGHCGQALGLRMEPVDSGEQALLRLQERAAQGEAYELLLVDWRMGSGMDGFELVQRLRGLAPGLPQPHIIMVTAQGREELLRRSEAEQGLLDGYLVKPVTPQMLLDAVQEARRTGQGGAASVALQPGAGKPLHKLRILVVEDNLNNQQVAQELLEDAGATVQLAGNGQVAVDILRASPEAFDLVLMDVQMPVMDGYSASRAIRQELRLAQLPIIAMTANVMASDRDECLAAGMNEHVGKPFDMDKLVDVILHSQERPEPAVQERRFATLAVPEDLQARALAQGFDAQSAMDRFMGKAELFQRMAQSFAKSALELPQQLSVKMAAHELDEAVLLAHSFKGLAATLGAQRLAELGAEGEATLKRGETLGADWLAALEQQLVPACAALLQLAQALMALKSGDRPKATAAGLGDAAEFKAAMASLLTLLQDWDMGATEAFSALRERHAERLQPEMPAIEQAISILNFEQALGLCRACLARVSA